MNRISYKTAESVTEGHPDKLCDLIADSILDVCLGVDPESRVACEVLATKGHIVIAGEITCNETVPIRKTVRNVLATVGYDPTDFRIDVFTHIDEITFCFRVDSQHVHTICPTPSRLPPW